MCNLWVGSYTNSNVQKHKLKFRTIVYPELRNLSA